MSMSSACRGKLNGKSVCGPGALMFTLFPAFVGLTSIVGDKLYNSIGIGEVLGKDDASCSEYDALC